MYHQQQQHARSEWKSRSQPPPTAWPGHSQPPPTAWPGHHSHHHSQVVGGPAPHVHRPPPPPIHYPPQHAQHRQHPHQHPQQQHQHPQHQQHHQQHPHHQHQHHSAAGMPHPHHHRQAYYHGNTGSPAGSCPPQEVRSMQHHTMRGGLPALVSPSTHQAAVAVTSPIFPQTVKSSSSSPREVNTVRITTPSAVATAAATAASASALSSAPHHPSSAANNANIITTKPPRPYTEYTMFYQLEREYILHRILTTEQEHALQTSNAIAAGTHNPTVALFQNDPLMPARFCSLPLRADWYISGKSKKPTKRKHRKSHGKIGFLELTRMIAARWAKVDDETRKYCKMMAAMELVKYKEDMESYNVYKDRLSAIGEIPEDMKERMLKKQRAQDKKDAAASKQRAKQEGGSVPVGIGAGGGGKKRAAPAIKADAVNSTSSGAAALSARSTSTKTSTSMKPIKLEPIAHDSPHETSNLDNDMEDFISSLVHDTITKTSTKKVTPERSNKKRRLFREKPPATPIVAEPTVTIAAASAVGDEIHVPLKDDDDHLDGIQMTFSGIDENEIAREFSDHVANRTTPPTGEMTTVGATCIRTMGPGPSFDYWDALVESPHL